MRKRGFAAVWLAAVLLCGCLARPAPVPQETGKVWSISANQTRLARFAAGGTEMIWACTLEFSAFKRGGGTLAGVYEGQLMLTYETDCYVNHLYTTEPPGLLEYDANRRSHTLSAPLKIELQAGAGAAPQDDLRGYDDAVLQALGAAPAQGGENAVSLYDVDDVGLPLPEVKTDGPAWASPPVCVQWEAPQRRVLWAGACQSMMELASGAGIGGYVPTPPQTTWNRLPGWPQSAEEDALPLWVEVAPSGAASIWLAGLVPFEATRPFEGMVYSGSSVVATTPGSHAASEAPPQPGSQFETGAENGDSSDVGVLSEEDALRQALAEYNLPLPNALTTGPTPRAGVLVYNIEGFQYRDALAYARKLKMGGYKKILAETEQPALDWYSLVAQSGAGRQLALQYHKGLTELTVF